MAKFGIISDTHFSNNDKNKLYYKLLNQLEETFKDVDEIIHAGDVSESFFLDDLENIAPVRCVRGESDNIPGLENFINFEVGKYTLGIIHKKPDKPIAPLPKKGFEQPIARPSVITLKIDDDNILSTFLINLNLR